MVSKLPRLCTETWKLSPAPAIISETLWKPRCKRWQLTGNQTETRSFQWQIKNFPLPHLTPPVIMNLPRCMIRSFACDDTARLFRLEKVRAFPPDIQRTALRKLAQLHAVTELLQLRVPPGNRLEALKGNRKGQHSIRINDQWRICFCWESDGPHEVEIVDYH